MYASVKFKQSSIINQLYCILLLFKFYCFCIKREKHHVLHISAIENKILLRKVLFIDIQLLQELASCTLEHAYSHLL